METLFPWKKEQELFISHLLLELMMQRSLLMLVFLQCLLKIQQVN